MVNPFICLIELRWKFVSKDAEIWLLLTSEKYPISSDLSWKNVYFTVPTSDTGGLVEKTKANGRKMVKELGNKAGRNLLEMPYPRFNRGSQQKIIKRLFI